ELLLAEAGQALGVALGGPAQPGGHRRAVLARLLGARRAQRRSGRSHRHVREAARGRAGRIAAAPRRPGRAPRRLRRPLRPERGGGLRILSLRRRLRQTLGGAGVSPPVSSLQTAAGLRLVGASAGSGKTYRLTEEVTRALAPGNAAGIDLEGLVGVTYTTKAQAELEARIRRVLTGSGAFERAQQLPLAYLGTVHAIGLRLLQEFALDAGLSPAVDVIPGNEGRRLLQATLESELAPDLRARLGALAVEFRLNWDGRTSRADWITPVDDIMTLARGNRIAPDRLPEMGRRSIDGL